MNSTAEALRPTERFFSNTENNPMNPRLILSKKLRGLLYELRIDSVARQSEVFGDGSIMPDHVAIYESRGASDVFYTVARDSEFNVLKTAYDSIKYSYAVPQMDHCDWSDEMKKKVAAWALKNTATKFKTMALNIDLTWYRNSPREEKSQAIERYTQDAEKAAEEARQILGDLKPLTVDELDYLVEKSVRQTLMPSS